MGERIKLQEMSLKELWQLFPITLVPYNPFWNEWAEHEILLLNKILADYSPIINHIGSTAIHGIFSKPIIDIIVEVPLSYEWKMIQQIMEDNDYILMSKSKKRMSFNKGYTISGFAKKVFHIHFHEPGDNNEILFRDLLRTYPIVAYQYEKLKLSLLPEYKYDRDGYTSAKTDFITDKLNLAKHKHLSHKQLIKELISEKLTLKDVAFIARISEDNNIKDILWELSDSKNHRISINALWIMTHWDVSESNWLECHQEQLIVGLLSENNASKKRLLLKLLKEQKFDADNESTIKLLDYCFSKINSECESYAVRSSCIFIAFNICQNYPELISELNEILQLLSMQSLSPGIKSALRQIKHKIGRHLKRQLKT